MTHRTLSTPALQMAYRDALESGALTWSERGRCVCAVCGRRGLWGCYWWEACAIGHPYACECGRLFSTAGGIAAHRRGGRAGTPCPRKPAQADAE